MNILVSAGRARQQLAGMSSGELVKARNPYRAYPSYSRVMFGE